MDEPQPPKRKRSGPPPSPFAVNALAVGHFLFAAVLIGGVMLNNTLEGSRLDQSLADSIGRIDSPQARTMQKSLERVATVKDGLHRHISLRAPASRWVHPLARTADVVLAILLIAAGVCLVQRQPMARPLSIAAAGLGLGSKFLLMAYLAVAEVPVAQKYAEPLYRMYPQETDLIRGVLAPIENGPAHQLWLAIYPLVVLAAMWHPGVRAALRPSRAAAPVPTGLPAAVRVEPLAPPPNAPLLTSVSAPADDPLEAMLQKKAF